MSLNSHLAELERKHQALEQEIQKAVTSPSASDAEIAQLKRKKLVLKDQMTRLRDGERPSPKPWMRSTSIHFNRKGRSRGLSIILRYRRASTVTTMTTSGASARLPTMIVSRLLKSCAIPPVIWPIASIRCARVSASSA